MKWLISAACALLVTTSSVNAQCPGGTIRSGLASACQQVTVSQTNIVASANKIVVPKFDDTAVPTAIVDGVHIVSLNVQYNPTGSYQTSSSASDFFVQASVTFVSATSSADGTVVEEDEWAGLIGTYGRSGLASSSGNLNGLAQRTFMRQDNTYAGAGNTLTAANGLITFTPASGISTSYISFTSTTGQLTMDVPTSSNYRGAGNWQITFGTAPFAGSSFSGGGLTVSLQQIVLVDAVVQYDYHLPAAINGDPQFAGFHGQHFQVHGVPDESFALISTPDYYINSKFVYIATGSCTYNDTACYTHPGTYMSEIYVGMVDTAVHVVAGPHHQGFSSVTVNGRQIMDKHRFALSGNASYIQRLSKSTFHVQLDALAFTITNSDHFVNIDINFGDSVLLRAGSKRHVITETEPTAVTVALASHYPSIPMHGLIGQTWRNVEYAGKQYIEGDVADYQLTSLRSHQFMFSKYNVQ